MHLYLEPKRRYDRGSNACLKSIRVNMKKKVATESKQLCFVYPTTMWWLNVSSFPTALDRIILFHKRAAMQLDCTLEFTVLHTVNKSGIYGKSGCVICCPFWSRKHWPVRHAPITPDHNTAMRSI